MSASLHFLPSMKATTASVAELREMCDFRRISYHCPEGRPELLRLFSPPHAGYYAQHWTAAKRADEAISEPGIVSFRPRHPLLRVRYNSGDWEIIALLPTGHRVTVLTGIPARPWIGAALSNIRQQIFDETSIWFDTATEDRAIR